MYYFFPFLHLTLFSFFLALFISLNYHCYSLIRLQSSKTKDENWFRQASAFVNLQIFKQLSSSIIDCFSHLLFINTKRTLQIFFPTVSTCFCPFFRPYIMSVRYDGKLAERLSLLGTLVIEPPSVRQGI